MSCESFSKGTIESIKFVIDSLSVLNLLFQQFNPFHSTLHLLNTHILILPEPFLTLLNNLQHVGPFFRTGKISPFSLDGLLHRIKQGFIRVLQLVHCMVLDVLMLHFLLFCQKMLLLVHQRTRLVGDELLVVWKCDMDDEVRIDHDVQGRRFEPVVPNQR